jgi:hypothetical protein
LFYYSSLGWNVSNPITDCTDYDFLAEDNGKIYKIQVKTTRFLSEHNNYEVRIVTSGGNQKEYWKKELNKDNLDYLFILTELGECYSIPIEEINTNNSITLGNKYDKSKVFKLNPIVYDECSNSYNEIEEHKNIKEKEYKYFCECGNPVSKKGGLCRSCSQKKRQNRKVERPSKEELLQLVKENGMTKTGKMFGVSDKSISKWLIDYELPGTIGGLKEQNYL